MAFDIISAKKAGYTDSEIADFLAQRQGFDLAGARKSGYSDTEIVSYLESKPGEEPAKDETPVWMQFLGSAVYDWMPGKPHLIGGVGKDLPEYPGENLLRQLQRGIGESATFQAPQLIKQLTGYDIVPELPVKTTGEAIARGAGELGGFLVGPGAAAGKVVAKATAKILPTTVRGLLAKSVGKQAATLGLASAVTEHGGESLEENLRKRLVAGAKGTAAGAVFASAGMMDIPGKPWLSRIGRFIAAEVGLDALQGKGPIEALMDDRPLAQKTFDYLLNAAFTWKPGTKLEVAQKRAEQIATKLAEENRLAAENTKREAKQEAAFRAGLSEAAIRRQAQVDAELSDAEATGRAYVGGKLVEPAETKVTKITPKPTIQALGATLEEQLRGALEQGAKAESTVIRREPNRVIEKRAEALQQTKALPPGQGFELKGVARGPGDVAINELQQKVEALQQTKALPPGQGFELVGKPTGKTTEFPRKVVAANKKPFKTMESASRALDAPRKDGPTFRDRGYEVVPYNEGFALHRTAKALQKPTADEARITKEVEAMGPTLKPEDKVNDITLKELAVKIKAGEDVTSHVQEAQVPPAKLMKKVTAGSKSKEPWEMTRAEWFEHTVQELEPGNKPLRDAGFQGAAPDMQQHYNQVANAQKEGKPVPPEVLADYPDLKTSTQVETSEPKMEKVTAKKKPSGESGGSTELSMFGTKQIADMARKAAKKWESGVEKSAQIEGKLLYEEMQKRAQASAERGEKIPKYAGSRNLERLNIPDEQKRIMMQTAEERGPKPKIPWTETIRMSKEEGKNYEQIKKKWEKTGAFNSRDITRARQLDVNAQATMRKVLDAFPEKPTPEDVVRFNQDVNTWKNEIDRVVDEASSEMGRGLNAHKIIISPEEKLNRVVAKLNRELDAREIDMWRKVDPFNPEAIRRFERTVNRPELKDYFTEYWYNMILSGPSTQAVNFASNTLWLAYNTSVGHAAKAMIDPFVSKLQKRPREYFMSEIIPMWAGMKKGAVRGKKLAGEVIKKGYTETGIHSKWDTEIGTMVGAFARSPHKTLRTIAPAVEMATRLLKAADVLAKATAFDGKLEGLAERIAKQEKLTGAAAVKRKAQLLSDIGEKQLTPMAHRMIDKAADFSNAMTFNQEPGKIGEWLLEGREGIVPGLRWVMPFVRTIGNLAKEGVKLTPGAGLLATKQGRAAVFHPITSGTGTTDILTKQIIGTVISMAIAGQYEQDNITGDWPDNPAERDAWGREGKTPWSIRIGDTWHSYRKYEPFSWPIAATAIVMDTFKKRGYKISKGEETDLMNDITKAGLGVVRFWLDSGYLSGVADIVSDITDATRGGAEGLLKSSKRFAASWMPYSSLMRQTAEAVEGETEGGAFVKQPKTTWQALKAQVPVWSKEVPRKLNVFGEEIKKSGGALRQLLPWKWSEETKDPVNKELSRLQAKPDIDLANIGFPQKSVDGIKLTDAQYRAYLQLVGPKLKTRLKSLVSAPGYKILPDKSKAKTLERIVGRIRKSAHDQFARTLGD